MAAFCEYHHSFGTVRRWLFLYTFFQCSSIGSSKSCGDADHRWENTAEVAQDSEGTYTLVLPANSVVTFTGNVK